MLRGLDGEVLQEKRKRFIPPSETKLMEWYVYLSVLISPQTSKRERRCGPDDLIRCWTFDCAGRVNVALRAAIPDNYRIIPLVLDCVFLCQIFS